MAATEEGEGTELDIERSKQSLAVVVSEAAGWSHIDQHTSMTSQNTDSSPRKRRVGGEQEELVDRRKQQKQNSRTDGYKSRHRNSQMLSMLLSRE